MMQQAVKDSIEMLLFAGDVIIAVGFKVNSERTVQFRKWVNRIAKDYTIKGWAWMMNS